MTKALLPKLEARGDGHIVLMGSVAGLEGYIGGAGYNAAKFRGARPPSGAPDGAARPADPGDRDRPGRRETEFSLVRFGGEPAHATTVYEGLTPCRTAATSPSASPSRHPAVAVDIDQIVLMPHDEAGTPDVPPPHLTTETVPVEGSTMPDPVFTGVAAAIVTFFDEHGSVDAASTARHASHLADRGVNAIVVAGTTMQEASRLSMKERLTLFDAIRGKCPQRCQ